MTFHENLVVLIKIKLKFLKFLINIKNNKLKN